MNLLTGPDHIEDYLASLHPGQWFGWSDPENKVYEDLVIYDEQYAKPTEQECIDGLKALQEQFKCQ
jgi:hypothetical protein